MHVVVVVLTDYQAPEGECYGLDCPPERFTKMHQLQPTTFVKNLYSTAFAAASLLLIHAHTAI